MSISNSVGSGYITGAKATKGYKEKVIWIL